MEHISLRLEESVVKEINRALKDFHYSTITDFFRDAVRTKLEELEKKKREEKAWKALFSARGALKGKGKAKTDEAWYELRKQAGEEYMKKLEKKFNQT
ncbi:MAG: ribbon-helix-helix domain-containing protein [archaeon]